jgi:hypothetical protein
MCKYLILTGLFLANFTQAQIMLPSYQAIQYVGPPFYPTNTVFCNGTPTEIVDVVSVATGRIWMDRNLGASQVAASSGDALSFGDLYQWGRLSDGHQCRNSGTTTGRSSSDIPGNSLFVRGSNGTTNDWRNPQNNNLWQGVNGINNPCPSGYRVPTRTELLVEVNSWGGSSLGAFNSTLKLPGAGSRDYLSNSFNGGECSYWTSSIVAAPYWQSYRYVALGNLYRVDLDYRQWGFSVRCIKN